MENFINTENLEIKSNKYKQEFFKTGNPYFFLIAQELDKTIEIKIENDKVQELEL